MRSDGSPWRQFGQSSLPPLFQSGTGREGAPEKSSKKSVSLSVFLDRKLGKNKSASAGGSFQERRCPFSSPRSAGDPSGTMKNENGKSVSLDGVLFRQFITRTEGERRTGSSNSGESGGESQPVSEEDGHGSRMRRNRFVNPAGEEGRATASKLLLVLGDDPKPRRKQGELSFSFKDRRPKPQFDHYSSGSGLWDCDREGVNSEEVGCKEVWEGMGSTTLGGLEWH